MADIFFRIGREIMNRPSMVRDKGDSHRRFRALFGVDPEVCAAAWDLVGFNFGFPKGCEKVHLMWTLLFLKTYKTENDLAAMLGGIDEKTLRKWVKIMVELLARLESEVVSDILFEKNHRFNSPLTCTFVCVFFRLYLRIDSKMMLGKIAPHQSIVPIVNSTLILGQQTSQSRGHSIRSSLKNLDSGMKLACASQQAILCGCTGHFHAGVSMTLPFFVTC